MHAEGPCPAHTSPTRPTCRSVDREDAGDRWRDGRSSHLECGPDTARELARPDACSVDPLTPGLVGYWNFDEEPGDQNLFDLSPLENDGFLGELAESRGPGSSPHRSHPYVLRPGRDPRCKLDRPAARLPLDPTQSCPRPGRDPPGRSHPGQRGSRSRDGGRTDRPTTVGSERADWPALVHVGRAVRRRVCDAERYLLPSRTIPRRQRSHSGRRGAPRSPRALTKTNRSVTKAVGGGCGRRPRPRMGSERFAERRRERRHPARNVGERRIAENATSRSRMRTS